MKNVDKVINEIRQMSKEDRGLVIDTILDDYEPDYGIDEELAKEIRRRVHAFKSGQTQGVPGEEAKARIGKLLEQ